MTPHYILVLDDGGKNLSRRPGQINDCAVRALAILTGEPYDEIYDLLANAGRIPCDGFDLSGWLTKRRGRTKWGVFKRVKVTGLDDRYSQRPHLTPVNFASYHRRGRFLLENADHVWAFLDGKAHDLWRVKNVPLEAAWEFIPHGKPTAVMSARTSGSPRTK